ncbi:Ig-like domain-containing protein, partial [Eudoraea sp.]|uniref:Ig-like domain-containing protein n=1 Tax=Eudoraea sp. TaxID=1979955 RepID=UPI003C744D87
AGPDSFTYTVDDDQGETSNVATVNVTVAAVVPPNVVNDAATVANSGAIAIDVLANDTDGDNPIDPTSLAIASAPTNGVAEILPGNLVGYTHNGSATLTDSFTYTVEDDQGNVSDPATVTMTIDAVVAPTANADGPITCAQAGSVFIDVVANDEAGTNPINPTDTAVVGQPTNGSVLKQADGRMFYTHDGTGTDSDSFTYVVRDSVGNASAPATVTLSIVSAATLTTPVAQWDVNTRGRTDDAFYDHVADDGTPETGINNPVLDSTGQLDGLNFNGSNQWVDIPWPANIPADFVDNDFTMAVRAKLEDLSVFHTIFTAAEVAVLNKRLELIQLTSDPGAANVNNGAGIVNNIDGVTPITVNQEFVLALRRNGNQATLWLNGVQDQGLTLGLNVLGALDRISLARRYSSSGGLGHFDGTIYWAAIWAGALTNQEMADMAATANPFFEGRQLSLESSPMVAGESVQVNLAGTWDVSGKTMTLNGVPVTPTGQGQNSITFTCPIIHDPGTFPDYQAMFYGDFNIEVTDTQPEGPSRLTAPMVKPADVEQFVIANQSTGGIFVNDDQVSDGDTCLFERVVIPAGAADISTIDPDGEIKASKRGAEYRYSVWDESLQLWSGYPAVNEILQINTGITRVRDPNEVEDGRITSGSSGVVVYGYNFYDVDNVVLTDFLGTQWQGVGTVNTADPDNSTFTFDLPLQAVTGFEPGPGTLALTSDIESANWPQQISVFINEDAYEVPTLDPVADQTFAENDGGLLFGITGQAKRPATLTWNPPLPPGYFSTLGTDPNTIDIYGSGADANEGVYNPKAILFDANNVSVERQFQITITTSDPVWDVVPDQSFGTEVAVSLDLNDYITRQPGSSGFFSISPLPEGLFLDNESGIIEGVTSQNVSAQVLTATFIDAFINAPIETTFAFDVVGVAPTWGVVPDQDNQVDETVSVDFSQYLDVQGTPPVTASFSALPAGLDSPPDSFLVQGVPTGPGNTTVTVDAINAFGQVTSNQFAWVVRQAPFVTAPIPDQSYAYGETITAIDL